MESQQPELETEADLLLKRLVIAWDADQDDELIELLDVARARYGLVKAEDGAEVLESLKASHAAEEDAEDAFWESSR